MYENLSDCVRKCTKYSEYLYGNSCIYKYLDLEVYKLETISFVEIELVL